MEYEVKNKEVYISIPAVNKGKFRFKTRKDNLKFGSSFATRSNIFDDKVYLEWQIGYDATKQELEKGKKNTKLTSKTFVGANGKTKYPYELSELLYSAVEVGLVGLNSVKELAKEIEGYKVYLDERKIDIEERGDLMLNGVKFKETRIKLPTFFASWAEDGIQIEVSIQKQQYATGVQPMIYWAIPLKSFSNWADLLGRESQRGDKLLYVINGKNADVLRTSFKIFAMASKSHNHDTQEILKVLTAILK